MDDAWKNDELENVFQEHKIARFHLALESYDEYRICWYCVHGKASAKSVFHFNAGFFGFV